MVHTKRTQQSLRLNEDKRGAKLTKQAFSIIHLGFSHLKVECPMAHVL